MRSYSLLHFLLLLAIVSCEYRVVATTKQGVRGVQVASRDLAPLTEEEDDDDRESVITCFDYSEALKIDSKGCNEWYIYRHLRDIYNEQNQLEETPRCDGGFQMELRRLTNTVETTGREWLTALKNLCDKAFVNSDALDNVDIVDWSRIEEADVDLEEFFQGGTYLNNDIGNLQQKTSEFERRGGYDRYHYIGEDPTKNDYLPTKQQSVDGGNAIIQFYNEELGTKFLDQSSFSGLQNDSCEATSAAVCCWSRDRQYNDNNGSCNSNGHCRNGNPGDNTDLCWTTSSDDNDVFPYPGGKTEGQLHCHGYSWNDVDVISDKTKHNNLFYVSLYDHLYKRGYVQSITDNEFQPIEGDAIPMCGCVEDMHPIARADCTEIIPRANYTAYQDEESGFLIVEPDMSEFYLEYKACEGYEYKADATPETYAENGNRGLRRKNNDLSAYVFRQYLEGKKSLEETEAFEETIIGYKDPNVNRGDNQRETACKNAFEERYPDVEWAEKSEKE